MMKPAETGVEDPEESRYSEDAARLVAAAGVDDPPELVVPYRLRHPLAPAVAAGLEGRGISREVVLTAHAELQLRHEFVFVEGAGGLAVPFDEELDMAGLALALGLPLLVVAPAGLGTINHGVLTVEYARARGLQVRAFLLNLCGTPPNLAESTNPAVLARLTGIQVYGPVDRLTLEDAGTPADAMAVEAVRRGAPGLVEALAGAALTR